MPARPGVGRPPPRLHLRSYINHPITYGPEKLFLYGSESPVCCASAPHAVRRARGARRAGAAGQAGAGRTRFVCAVAVDLRSVCAAHVPVCKERAGQAGGAGPRVLAKAAAKTAHAAEEGGGGEVTRAHGAAGA